MNTGKWDERYGEPQFAYGKAPNLFFKEWLQKLPSGSILMPAEGEGRNGVYAATLGWTVTAFDQSKAGQSKAYLLAKEQVVSIEYLVGDLDHLTFEPESFDAIGLIYAHFDGTQKAAYHKKLSSYLKKGGIIIFEAFSKTHINYINLDPNVGGPRDLNTLFSKEELATDFHDYEILHLSEEEILLNEGNYHNGKGSVIRFVGRKNKQQ